MKRKFFALALLPLLMSACGSKADFTVGILLPVTHSALIAAQDGFVKVIEEAGLNVAFKKQNALGNSSDQTTMAKTLATSCDMVLGIGTGASVSLKSAVASAGLDTPVLFTAVTDPVGAGLVDSLTAPGHNVTGASDAQPIQAQIALIKQCLPSADKVGIIYTESETNSAIQATSAKTALENDGISVTVKTCTNESDIASTASSLASIEGMDAIFVPTDNNIAAHLNYVMSAANLNGVLVVGGEESQVANGAHITLSISYSELGKRTGELAVKILKGEKSPSELAVVTMTQEDCVLVWNSTAVAAAGLSLPSSVTDGATDLGGNN